MTAMHTPATTDTLHNSWFLAVQDSATLERCRVYEAMNSMLLSLWALPHTSDRKFTMLPRSLWYYRVAGSRGSICITLELISSALKPHGNKTHGTTLCPSRIRIATPKNYLKSRTHYGVHNRTPINRGNTLGVTIRLKAYILTTSASAHPSLRCVNTYAVRRGIGTTVECLCIIFLVAAPL